MDELKKKCLSLYMEKHKTSEEDTLSLFKKYNIQELITMSYPDLQEMDDQRLLTEIELYFEVSELTFN